LRISGLWVKYKNTLKIEVIHKKGIEKDKHGVDKVTKKYRVVGTSRNAENFLLFARNTLLTI
jgi:hypothetical protein